NLRSAISIRMPFYINGRGRANRENLRKRGEIVLGFRGQTRTARTEEDRTIGHMIFDLLAAAIDGRLVGVGTCSIYSRGGRQGGFGCFFLFRRLLGFQEVTRIG